MPYSIDEVQQKLIDDINVTGDADEVSTRVKNLKTFAEAKKQLEPDPIPEPEPSGAKAFFNHHAGDLIKVGGSIVVVSIIAVIEAKHDIIFRSKASKFI
jgi:hypothetical protein